jgi:hypothetical protein
MKIEFKKARSFGQKVNATFAFISENSRDLFKTQFMVVGPLILLVALVVSALQYYGMQAVMSRVGDPNAVGPINPSLGMGVFGGYIITIISTFAITGAIYAIILRQLQVYQSSGSVKLDVAHTLKTIWSLAFEVIGVGMAIGAMAAIAFICLILPIGILMAGLMAIHPAFAIIGVIMFFGAFCIVIGTLSLVFPAVFLDKKPLTSAISYVFSLQKGNWFSTGGLILVMGLIGAVISSIFILPSLALGIGAAMHITDGFTAVDNFETGAMPGLITIFTLVTTAIQYLSYIVSGTIIMVAVTLQYYNLKEKHGAHGLLEKIADFDNMAPLAAAHEEERY